MPKKLKENSLKKGFIDRIRDSLIQNFSLNYIRNKLRIINIYNTGQKNFHRLYNISIGKKFTNGLIRNGHDVLEISDRDFIRQNRFLTINSNQNDFALIKSKCIIKNYPAKGQDNNFVYVIIFNI